MSAWRGTAWGPLRVGLKIQNKSIEGKRRGRGEKTGEQNPEAGVGAGTPGGGQSTFQGHRSWPRPQLQAWPVGRTRGCVQAARRAGGGGGSCTGRGGGVHHPLQTCSDRPPQAVPRAPPLRCPSEDTLGPGSWHGDAPSTRFVSGPGTSGRTSSLASCPAGKIFLLRSSTIVGSGNRRRPPQALFRRGIVVWHHGCACIPGRASCCCESGSMGDGATSRGSPRCPGSWEKKGGVGPALPSVRAWDPH